jgi:hypothetical protein
MIKKEDAEMLLVNEINNALDNELSEEQYRPSLTGSFRKED